MDMYRHRRQRLLDLISAQHGGERVRFCDRTQLSESRLAQILSPTYRSGEAFTEKTARKLERLAKLPAMYFDQNVAPVVQEQPQSIGLTQAQATFAASLDPKAKTADERELLTMYRHANDIEMDMFNIAVENVRERIQRDGGGEAEASGAAIS